MEQPALGFAVLALGAVLGCVEIPASAPPSLLMTPAGHANGDSRPVDIHPPVTLAYDYEQAIVRLVVDVSPTATQACTGTLIAEDLVVTAHHCVTRHDTSEPWPGRPLREDVSPKAVSVEFGTTAMPWAEVKVTAIVTPDCGYDAEDARADGGDVAVLVLSRKLVGVPTISPSAEPPRLNDQLGARGYGVCTGERWRGVQLEDRHGGTIDFEDRGRIWGVAEICPGDSGGPVFVIVDPNNRKSDRLVGVVSTSVMDRAHAMGFTSMTRIDAWPQLLSAAHEIARGATSSELPPYRSCAPQISTQAAQAKPKGNKTR